MKIIRIDFCDFGSNWNKMEDYVYKMPSERSELELRDQPDFLIHACGGHAHLRHSGVNFFHSWKSDLPDFRRCDYAIASVKLDDPRHLHWHRMSPPGW